MLLIEVCALTLYIVQGTEGVEAWREKALILMLELYASIQDMETAYRQMLEISQDVFKIQ